MTDSNRVRFAMVKEATHNVTPTNPVMQIMRVESISLSESNKTVTSDQIKSSRLSNAAILTGRTTTGGFTFEFSDTIFDDLMIASLLGTRQKIADINNGGVADSNITQVTNSSATYAVASGGAAFVSGHLVRAAGFIAAGNNGLFRVTSSTGTTIVQAGLTLVDEAAPPGAADLRVVGFRGASGDITATAGGLASTILDFTTLGLTVGGMIKMGGATAGEQFAINAANNDFARITGIAAHVLTLDSLPTGWAVDAGTAKTITVYVADVVKVGTNLDGNTFTAETAHLDQAVPTYFVDSGLAVNKLSFKAPVQSKLTCAVDFLGITSLTPATAAISGATYTPAPTTGIYNTTSNCSRIMENGVVLGSPTWVTELDFDISNNLRELLGIGNLSAVDIGKGECMVTGKLTAYFGSVALYNRARNLTSTSVQAIFKSPVGNKAYVFNFPTVQLDAPRPNAGGINQDIVVNATINASEDSVTGTNVQIDMFYEMA